MHPSSRIHKPSHKRANSKASTKASTTTDKSTPITAYIQGDYKTTLESVRPQQQDKKNTKQTTNEQIETNRMMQPHVLFALNVKASQQNTLISNQVVNMITSSSSIINGQLQQPKQQLKAVPTTSMEIQQQELLQYCDLLQEFLDSSVIDSLEFPQLDSIITNLKEAQLQQDSTSSRLHKNVEQAEDVQYFAAPMSYLNPLGGSKYAAHMQKEDQEGSDVILNKDISQRILKTRKEYPQYKEEFENRIKTLVTQLFVKLQVLNQATFLGQPKRYSKAFQVSKKTENAKMLTFITGMNDLIFSQIQQLSEENL